MGTRLARGFHKVKVRLRSCLALPIWLSSGVLNAGANFASAPKIALSQTITNDLDEAVRNTGLGSNEIQKTG